MYVNTKYLTPQVEVTRLLSTNITTVSVEGRLEGRVGRRIGQRYDRGFGPGIKFSKRESTLSFVERVRSTTLYN